jgi:hypothetical protein
MANRSGVPAVGQFLISGTVLPEQVKGRGWK